MKLLYASGFSVAERKTYRRIIFFNILNSFRVVLEAMAFYGLTFETEGNKVLFLAHHPNQLGVCR
jgi:guanine nucleotide-binding protein subunit alpha